MNLRPKEIANNFIAIIEQHLNALVAGKVDDYLDIHQITKQLFIHPRHLINTVKEVTGKSPCDICNEKTIAVAKQLLDNPQLSIASIAIILTYEPTNFTKYFKKHTGITPSQYRAKKSSV
jgi:AraC family transcriptional regulator of adaptative response / methylphosphotriester-DNA alkyltransferase methyltransferase